MTTTFAQLGLHAQLQNNLAHNKFVNPTPVQAQAIPAALEGRDILASAQTGTGKTGAFVLPALHKMLNNQSASRGRGPRVLVLTPTRELAQQVLDNTRLFGRDCRFQTGVIVGGVSYGPQFKMLEGKLDMLVATPGRLIDHLQQKRIDFSRVEMVVLDEADRMLDMGFLAPVEKILAAIQAAAGRPQMMLFSATFTDSVGKFAKRVLKDPATVNLAPAKVDNSQITQMAYRADNATHKFDMLTNLLENGILQGEKRTPMGQVIIFGATKHGCDKLAKRLEQAGYDCAAMHGGMKQNARKRTLDKLHRGEIQILVATDVAARGIDVKQLSTVLNFDLPQVAEDYVHRIGRTGRAGETGIAISLIAPSDVPMLRDIEKVLGRKMTMASIGGLEPALNDAEFDRQGAAAPRSRQGNRGRGFGGGKPSFGDRKPSFGDRKPSFGGDRPRREGGFNKPRSFGGNDRAAGAPAGEGRREFRGERPSHRAEGARPAHRTEGGRSEGGNFKPRRPFRANRENRG
ncbi:MAG: DEAD/DEAH box helicase [Alphaproteobacteria bacterium]